MWGKMRKTLTFLVLGMLLSIPQAPSQARNITGVKSFGVDVSISGQFTFYDDSLGAMLVKTTLGLKNTNSSYAMTCDVKVEFVKDGWVQSDYTFNWIGEIPPNSTRYVSNYGNVIDPGSGEYTDWDTTRISRVNCSKSWISEMKNGSVFTYKIGQTFQEGDYLHTYITVKNSSKFKYRSGNNVHVVAPNGEVVLATIMTGTKKCKPTIILKPKESIRCEVIRHIDTPFKKWVVQWKSW